MKKKTIPIVVLLFVSTLLGAQDFNSITPTTEKKKPWFNTPTKIELSISAATIAADGWTTRNFPPTKHELNPIARPFAKSDGKSAAYFGLSFGGQVYSNYLLRNHTKIRHILNWSVIGVETYWSIHNSRLRK